MDEVEISEVKEPVSISKEVMSMRLRTEINIVGSGVTRCRWI